MAEELLREEPAHCDVHGIDFTKVFRDIGSYKDRHGSDCPECSAQREAERKRRAEEDVARKKRDRITRLRDASCIPSRFRVASFDGYIADTPERQKALRIARGYADNFSKVECKGSNLILAGTVGTGKTHLGCAIGNALIATEWSVIYTTVYDMLREIKSTWNRDSRHTEEEIINKFCRKDLLILDEIGVAFGSDTERLLLFAVLNGRYEDLRPTVIISNLDKNGLVEYLGPRAVDRLLENGSAMVVCDWASYRQTGKAFATSRERNPAKENAKDDDPFGVMESKLQ